MRQDLLKELRCDERIHLRIMGGGNRYVVLLREREQVLVLLDTAIMPAEFPALLQHPLMELERVHRRSIKAPRSQPFQFLVQESQVQ